MSKAGFDKYKEPGAIEKDKTKATTKDKATTKPATTEAPAEQDTKKEKSNDAQSTDATKVDNQATQSSRKETRVQGNNKVEVEVPQTTELESSKNTTSPSHNKDNRDLVTVNTRTKNKFGTEILKTASGDFADIDNDGLYKNFDKPDDNTNYALIDDKLHPLEELSNFITETKFQLYNSLNNPSDIYGRINNGQFSKLTKNTTGPLKGSYSYIDSEDSNKSYNIGKFKRTQSDEYFSEINTLDNGRISNGPFDSDSSNTSFKYEGRNYKFKNYGHIINGAEAKSSSSKLIAYDASSYKQLQEPVPDVIRDYQDIHADLVKYQRPRDSIPPTQEMIQKSTGLFNAVTADETFNLDKLRALEKFLKNQP